MKVEKFDKNLSISFLVYDKYYHIFNVSCYGGFWAEYTYFFENGSCTIYKYDFINCMELVINYKNLIFKCDKTGMSIVDKNTQNTWFIIKNGEVYRPGPKQNMSLNKKSSVMSYSAERKLFLQHFEKFFEDCISRYDDLYVKIQDKEDFKKHFKNVLLEMDLSYYNEPDIIYNIVDGVVDLSDGNFAKDAKYWIEYINSKELLENYLNYDSNMSTIDDVSIYNYLANKHIDITKIDFEILSNAIDKVLVEIKMINPLLVSYKNIAFRIKSIVENMQKEKNEEKVRESFQDVYKKMLEIYKKTSGWVEYYSSVFKTDSLKRDVCLNDDNYDKLRMCEEYGIYNEENLIIDFLNRNFVIIDDSVFKKNISEFMKLLDYMKSFGIVDEGDNSLEIQSFANFDNFVKAMRFVNINFDLGINR